MSHPSKTKGDKAEREVAALISDLLGVECRRKLGAGRSDDEGDLEGLPGWTLEVKNYKSISDGVNAGLADCVKEQANARTPFGAALIRRPGGRWFVAMTIEQWATTVRETM